LHFGWNLAVGVAVWHAFPNPAPKSLRHRHAGLDAYRYRVTANHLILDAVAGTIVVAFGATLAFMLQSYGRAHFDGDGAIQEGLRWLLGVFRPADSSASRSAP
jgi:ABC-type Fe3+ transport system permease subunit